MTFLRACRWLLGLATILLIFWSFADVTARWWRDLRPGRGKVTLTILQWGTPDEVAIMQDLVNRFEKDHPNIHVERLHANDYDSKLKTMFSGGMAPDLFYLSYENVPEMAGLGLLKNLDPYIQSQKASGQGKWLDDFYPILLDAFRYDGTHTGKGPLYGLPKDFTTMVMYVNTDLFARAGVKVPYDGWTWDQYQSDMKRITALNPPGGGRIYGGVLNTWPAVLRNIVWTYGGEFFGDNFKDVELGQPNAQAALKMIYRTRFVDKSVFNATGLGRDGGQEFYTGNIGCIGPLGRWMTPRYRGITNFHWDVVPMPHEKQKASAIATVAWCVSAQTRHPKESLELLKFLCGPEGQAMAAKLGLAIPSLKSVAHSDAFLSPGQNPRHTPIFLEAMKYARLGQNPRDNAFNRILPEEMDEAIRMGRVSTQTAAARVKTRWLAELASPLVTKKYPPMPWTLIGSIAAAVILAAGVITWWVSRRRKIGALDRRQEWAGWLFVSPWVLGFVALTLGPMILSLLLALTKWTGLTPLWQAHYVGWDNFIQLFRADPTFGKSLWVTTYYALLAVPIGQAAALAVGLLMNSRVKGIALFRTVYFLPSVVSGVALATLWLWIFNNDYGLLNQILRPIASLLGTTPPNWFGQDADIWAVPAFVIMSLWGVGSGMIIYLAGLKSIPQGLYEAATIDGAGPIRRFWNVTLPMLSPLIFYNVVMAIIGSFQVFTQAKVMTNGQPRDSSLFYVLNLYQQAFELHNMGYASAMAWVLFVLVLLLTLLVFRGSKNFVYYEGLKA